MKDLLNFEGVIFDGNAEIYKHWDDRNVLFSSDGRSEIVQTDHSIVIVGLNEGSAHLSNNLTIRMTHEVFEPGPDAGQEVEIPDNHSCAICNKASPDTTLLECGHFFHWNCLALQDQHIFPLHFSPSSIVCQVCCTSCTSWDKEIRLESIMT